MGSVSAAEFVRNFARLRIEAQADPIFITNHGRETHVLCDVGTWRALVDAAQANGLPPSPTGDEDMAFGLADWMNEGIIACDESLTIVFANRVAHGLVRARPGSLVGRTLGNALPRLAGSLMEAQARQTIARGESNMADIPSPFIENGWLRFQTFPLNNRLVLSLRDVTLEVDVHFKASIKEAIIDAMDRHGGISYVRLSLRGTIDRVDATFSRLIDLPEARLTGIALGDLVATPDRPRFRAALEAVLRGGEPARVAISFLTNRGDLQRMRVSIVRLDGLYGCDGAIAILTEDGEADTGAGRHDDDRDNPGHPSDPNRRTGS